MESDDGGGVSLKQVKLKVLYTFDNEHKNNHLARWPHSLFVQSAQVDETSIIGIVSLRTCLEAVTTASPELVSTIDNDFTVYAYDYSEEDSPLVGQGLLSKALADETGGDVEGEAMVTGRITRNVMGLFSKSAQETLEVKLRLKPVAAPFRRRSGSVCSNGDNVQQQWNSLSQTNGVFRPSSPMNTSGLETMQRMLSEGSTRPGSYQSDTFYQPSSRPTSRAGTPVQPQHLYPPPRQSTGQSRPSSRAGTRQTQARRDSFNSGYYSAEEAIEEGPARKRAKILRVDPSKSDFNIERQPDSLRVAASTASSVRLHRPVPQHPGIAALQHGSPPLEESVRPPTPIPHDKPRRPRGRPKKVISPNLLNVHKKRRSSPALQQDDPEPSVSSPEDERRGDSATSTPANLPSSPPVMPDQQNLVTSPALPPMMNDGDSGFMSGNLDDLFDAQLLDFGDYFTDQAHQHNLDETAISAGAPALDEGQVIQSEARGRAVSEMPPPPEMPQAAQPSLPAKCNRPLGRAQSFTPGLRPIVPAPRLAPAMPAQEVEVAPNRRAGHLLAQIPASDPVERTFHRSQTWAPEMSDAIMSDAGPAVGDDATVPKSKKRVGKEQTRARLEQAIANGQMPPFCDNCGSIETPAWRRAFIKVFDSPYDEFETSLGTGECCYKEPLEKDKEGNIKTWKGYRTEKRPDEKTADGDGWKQINLCNPCGLWFHKSKYPRPPEKWQKRDPNEKRKRKRGPRSKKRSEPPRQIVQKSDAATPASDDSSPTDTAADGGDGDGDGDDFDDSMTSIEESNEDNEPQLPPMPARAGSAEPPPRGLAFAAAREAATRRVQSSPIRNARTNAHQVSLTPRPLRRQLFPSPSSLTNRANVQAPPTRGESNLPVFVRRSPRLNKTRDIFARGFETSTLLTVDGEEKENMAPAPETNHDVDFHDLFGGGAGIGDEDFMPPPMTPTPKRRSEMVVIKTPGETPSRRLGAVISPNAGSKPSLTRTPKHKIHPAASILIGTVQRNLDPADMTPFSRSIHMAFSGEIERDLTNPRTPSTGNLRRSKRTPRKGTPKTGGNFFDFPDLPSLNGSSPMSGNPNFVVNFSEMTTDQLHTEFTEYIPTDGPMPSSPPKGLFDYINTHDDELEDIWGNMATPDRSKAIHADFGESKYLAAASGPCNGLRRSPRKHVA